MNALHCSIRTSGEKEAGGGETRSGQPVVFCGAEGDSDGVLELWGAVLLQAIEDYQRKGAGFDMAVNGIRLRGWYYDREIRRDRRRAEEWFKSNREDMGSFRWICDLLKLDPDRVWARIKQKDFVLTL